MATNDNTPALIATGPRLVVFIVDEDGGYILHTFPKGDQRWPEMWSDLQRAIMALVDVGAREAHLLQGTYHADQFYGDGLDPLFEIVINYHIEGLSEQELDEAEERDYQGNPDKIIVRIQHHMEDACDLIDSDDLETIFEAENGWYDPSVALTYDANSRNRNPLPIA